MLHFYIRPMPACCLCICLSLRLLQGYAPSIPLNPAHPALRLPLDVHFTPSFSERLVGKLETWLSSRACFALRAPKLCLGMYLLVLCPVLFPYHSIDISPSPEISSTNISTHISTSRLSSPAEGMPAVHHSSSGRTRARWERASLVLLMPSSFHPIPLYQRTGSD